MDTYINGGVFNIVRTRSMAATWDGGHAKQQSVAQRMAKKLRRARLLAMSPQGGRPVLRCLERGASPVDT